MFNFFIPRIAYAFEWTNEQKKEKNEWMKF